MALLLAKQRRASPVRLELPMPAPKYTQIPAAGGTALEGEREEEAEAESEARREKEDALRACRDQVAFGVRDIGLRRFQARILKTSVPHGCSAGTPYSTFLHDMLDMIDM